MEHKKAIAQKTILNQMLRIINSIDERSMEVKEYKKEYEICLNTPDIEKTAIVMDKLNYLPKWIKSGELEIQANTDVYNNLIKEINL